MVMAGLHGHSIFVVVLVLLTSRVRGHELFDFNNEQCCNGTVHKSKPNFRCCGNNYFDNVNGTVLCCGNHLVDFPPNSERSRMNCCRNDQGLFHTFDDTQAMCCQGRIVPISSVQSSGSTTQVPICCGQQLFIPSDVLTCCNNTVIDKSTLPGGVAMTCCGSLGLVNLEAGRECCGSRIIDTSQEICCKKYKYRDYGKPMEHGGHRPTDFGVMVAETMSKVHPKTVNGSTFECCGLSAYDNTQVCCASQKLGGHKKVLPKPPEMADHHQQLECCGDVVIAYDPASQRCCDWKTPYNPRTSTCCGGRTAAIDENASSATCCWQSGEFYDEATHFCCDAGVMSRGGNASLSSLNPGCCMPDQYH